MVIWELLLVAVGLSMDAFAVSVCHGLSMRKATFVKAFIVGLYFGVFQALMPLIGYFVGVFFAGQVEAFDHWIAFTLLTAIGIKMIIECFRRAKCPDRPCPKNKKCKDRECPNKADGEVSLKPQKMLPSAIATSIDALAVGVSFAFLSASIFPAVLLIGICTMVLSVIGVKIGNLFGNKMKSKAEILGGIILILMGVKIILEHTGVI